MSAKFNGSTKFTNREDGTIIVQDVSKPGLDDKLALINRLLSFAETWSKTGLVWCINFTSASDFFGGPAGYAEDLNPKLSQVLNNTQGPVGTIVMDYPDYYHGEKDIIQQIIDHNFESSKFVLQAVNNKYVSSGGGGGKDVVANGSNIGPSETLSLIDAEANVVSIQSSDGVVFGAENGRLVGVNEGNAGRTVPFFRIENRGNGKVALLSLANNGDKYVGTANGGGGTVLTANNRSIGAREEFKVKYISESNGCPADPGGPHVRLCLPRRSDDRYNLCRPAQYRNAQTFTVVNLGATQVRLKNKSGRVVGYAVADQVALKTASGHYLGVNDEVNDAGYKVRLMSWDPLKVPTTGQNRVIAGIDSTGLLHIRVFHTGYYTETFEQLPAGFRNYSSGTAHLLHEDYGAGVHYNLPESSLSKARVKAIADLREQLQVFGPNHSLRANEKKQILEEVTSITGDTHNAVYASQGDIGRLETFNLFQVQSGVDGLVTALQDAHGRYLEAVGGRLVATENPTNVPGKMFRLVPLPPTAPVNAGSVQTQLQSAIKQYRGS